MRDGPHEPDDAVSPIERASVEKGRALKHPAPLEAGYPRVDLREIENFHVEAVTEPLNLTTFCFAISEIKG
jgi:hypothetical protein